MLQDKELEEQNQQGHHSALGTKHTHTRTPAYTVQLHFHAVAHKKLERHVPTVSNTSKHAMSKLDMSDIS